MRRRFVPMVVAVLALGLAGCGGDDADSGTASGGDDHGEHGHGEGGAAFSEQEADSVVTATMRDFAIDMPGTVKGRKVFFRVPNEGPTEHEFVVVGPDGEPVGGIEAYPPRMLKTVALELAPGAYTAACFVKLGDKTHAQLGMERRFTVE